MSAWYYADRNRNRQGPVESAALARLFREGRLQLDSLVWREGLANWQPLGDFAAELGLLEDAPVAHAPEESGTLSLEPMETARPGGNSAADFGRAVFASRESVAAASPYAAPAATLTNRDSMASAGGRVVYAGFWKRYAASFIDGMIGFAITMVSVIATMGVAGGLGAFSGNVSPGAGAIGSMLLGFYAIPILFQAAYFTWMQASVRQATLGKMAVGIKVARSDGQPIMLGRSLGRWAAYFFINMASCGVGTLVSAIMVGTSERKQGLHDLACDTLVVDKWAFTAHPERQNDEVGSVTIVMIGLSLLFVFGYLALIIFSATMGGR
ncbi:RDD family protein [Pseudoxanthomonas helianthi]|uniref:RDD family protein n=1 Tax=Pseudoxanthomonas helianthi TaxID=1453541 RepID=A0A941ASU6_9GAMM|nr:RDD family protein [Pseudoxanthomonas helianthi]MBP3983685.1 RDD family protein [Pseudoxanthomonas helianthi]